MKNYVLNVKDYGAKGDGTTDDSAAFKTCIAIAESSRIASPFGMNINAGSVKILVPAGQYLITQPDALMRSSYVQVGTMGLMIQGEGKGISQICFNPTTTGTYLLQNQDSWAHIIISNMSFYGASNKANFMHSTASLAAQNFIFEHCNWHGTWNYIFLLEGDNINSEMSWFHCNFNGSFAKAVYAPAASGSDQFLNYNFFACQFETYTGGTGGDFLDFGKGGSINIWGGSFIHQGTSTGTMFRLGKTNSNKSSPDVFHSNGTPRFLCQGARFEHHNTSSILLELNWGYGNVVFQSCDSTAVQPSSYSNVLVDCSNATPILKFTACGLIGTHKFLVNGGSANQMNTNVTYESCFFASVNRAADQIVIDDNTFGGATGGRPSVSFKKCRGTSQSASDAFNMEADDGYLVANRTLTTEKIAIVRNLAGKLPANGDGTFTFTLPLNALILSVRFWAPAGAVSSTANAAYTIKTNEGTPTTIATLNSTNASLGFDTTYTTGLPFLCDTDLKRTLILQAGAATDQPNPKGIIYVKFIG